MQALFNPETTSKVRLTAKSSVRKPILQLGSVGAEVLELQKLLAQCGTYTGPMGGYFDRSVHDAVMDFQQSMFLKADGIVDHLTWQALYQGAPVNMPVLNRGSRHDMVIPLQWVLHLTQDYAAPIDGDFGEQTECAVRSFQKRHGLVVDGVVGEQTWNALSQVHVSLFHNRCQDALVAV
ncbi:MAG: peptidoglycan-binding protein [Coleofasciculus sp. C2-GNP5-27]